MSIKLQAENNSVKICLSTVSGNLGFYFKKYSMSVLLSIDFTLQLSIINNGKQQSHPLLFTVYYFIISFIKKYVIQCAWKVKGKMKGLSKSCFYPRSNSTSKSKGL